MTDKKNETQRRRLAPVFRLDNCRLGLAEKVEAEPVNRLKRGGVVMHDIAWLRGVLFNELEHLGNNRQVERVHSRRGLA